MTFLKEVLKSAEKKLKEIQRSKDQVKKRWLVGLSSISMIFVIGLWLIYLNASLPQLNTAKKNDISPKNTDVSKKDLSFLETFGRGFGVITSNIKDGATKFFREVEKPFNEFKKQLGKSKNFSLNGEELDFTYTNFDPIPKTHLP